MSQSSISPVSSEGEAMQLNMRKPAARPRAASSRQKKSGMTPEQIFRWRIFGGLIMLLLFTPFLTVSLLSPGLTGYSGRVVASTLGYFLGQASWILPLATLSLALYLLEASSRRELDIKFAIPVLMLDMLLLAARLDGQGGTVGRSLDNLLMHSVGSLGAWMLVTAGFVFGFCLLWQVRSEEFLATLVIIGRLIIKAAISTWRFCLVGLKKLGKVLLYLAIAFGGLCASLFARWTKRGEEVEEYYEEVDNYQDEYGQQYEESYRQEPDFSSGHNSNAQDNFSNFDFFDDLANDNNSNYPSQSNETSSRTSQNLDYTQMRTGVAPQPTTGQMRTGWSEVKNDSQLVRNAWGNQVAVNAENTRVGGTGQLPFEDSARAKPSESTSSAYLQKDNSLAPRGICDDYDNNADTDFFAELEKEYSNSNNVSKLSDTLVEHAPASSVNSGKADFVNKNEEVNFAQEFAEAELVSAECAGLSHANAAGTSGKSDLCKTGIVNNNIAVNNTNEDKHKDNGNFSDTVKGFVGSTLRNATSALQSLRLRNVSPERERQISNENSAPKPSNTDEKVLVASSLKGKLSDKDTSQPSAFEDSNLGTGLHRDSVSKLQWLEGGDILSASADAKVSGVLGTNLKQPEVYLDSFGRLAQSDKSLENSNQKHTEADDSHTIPENTGVINSQNNTKVGVVKDVSSLMAYGIRPNNKNAKSSASSLAGSLTKKNQGEQKDDKVVSQPLNSNDAERPRSGRLSDIPGFNKGSNVENSQKPSQKTGSINSAGDLSAFGITRGVKTAGSGRRNPADTRVVGNNNVTEENQALSDLEVRKDAGFVPQPGTLRSGRLSDIPGFNKGSNIENSQKPSQTGSINSAGDLSAFGITRGVKTAGSGKRYVAAEEKPAISSGLALNQNSTSLSGPGTLRSGRLSDIPGFNKGSNVENSQKPSQTGSINSAGDLSAFGITRGVKTARNANAIKPSTLSGAEALNAFGIRRSSAKNSNPSASTDNQTVAAVLKVSDSTESVAAANTSALENAASRKFDSKERIKRSGNVSAANMAAANLAAIAARAQANRAASQVPFAPESNLSLLDNKDSHAISKENTGGEIAKSESGEVAVSGIITPSSEVVMHNMHHSQGNNQNIANKTNSNDTNAHCDSEVKKPLKNSAYKDISPLELARKHALAIRSSQNTVSNIVSKRKSGEQHEALANVRHSESSEQKATSHSPEPLLSEPKNPSSVDNAPNNTPEKQNTIQTRIPSANISNRFGKIDTLNNSDNKDNNKTNDSASLDLDVLQTGVLNTNTDFEVNNNNNNINSAETKQTSVSYTEPDFNAANAATAATNYENRFLVDNKKTSLDPLVEKDNTNNNNSHINTNVLPKDSTSLDKEVLNERSDNSQIDKKVDNFTEINNKSNVSSGNTLVTKQPSFVRNSYSGSKTLFDHGRIAQKLGECSSSSIEIPSVLSSNNQGKVVYNKSFEAQNSSAKNADNIEHSSPISNNYVKTNNETAKNTRSSEEIVNPSVSKKPGLVNTNRHLLLKPGLSSRPMMGANREVLCRTANEPVRNVSLSKNGHPSVMAPQIDKPFLKPTLREAVREAEHVLPHAESVIDAPTVAASSNYQNSNSSREISSGSCSYDSSDMVDPRSFADSRIPKVAPMPEYPLAYSCTNDQNKSGQTSQNTANSSYAKRLTISEFRKDSAEDQSISTNGEQAYLPLPNRFEAKGGSKPYKDSSFYNLPPISLLDDGPVQRRVTPLVDKSALLVDTLASFGVKATVRNVVQGPAVTRYELEPARGVRVKKFTELTNDIALALAAKSIRIEAPVPGKSAVGIEVPNSNTELVVLKDIIGSQVYNLGKGLCIGLGKDITGSARVTDLEKMPHLLVAGTTGSGKSVCINALILSLIYRYTPSRLQLLMIDPKQVELSIYEGIPHLVGLSGESAGKIVVDPKKAAAALRQVVDLMEARYTLFAENKVRNLKEYNSHSQEPLPWMVVIIDELADLMMVAGKAVEASICRLAQKARAAGIHIVVATQRPSTDVITGLIKVNIPSRIAFAVSSGVDSRVILDVGGAEHLLGKGDMLFKPVDASEPSRIQGAYVTNEEIQKVVEFWSSQEAPSNRIELEVTDTQAEDNTEEAKEEDSDEPVIREALAAIMRTKQASASGLQTELRIGYAKARRIINTLEKRGYIGPPDGSKPRQIYYTGEDTE